LVGGYDEMTPSYFKLLDRVGLWKKEITTSAELNQTNSTGTLAGEGSVSVMLSDKKNERTYAAIDALEILYKPENFEAAIIDFLNRNGMTTTDIDLVVLGLNGDVQGDEIYKTTAANLFENKAQAWYKHLSGEYFTSAGFGLWFAANCIKYRMVPNYAVLNSKSAGGFEHVLLLNHYQNKNYSLILLSAC
jgi:3-oxoacyl-[acyl-carrier-protein] synthase II